MWSSGRSSEQTRRIQVDFLKADLEIGFALVDAAGNANRQGYREHARLELEEAHCAVRRACDLLNTLTGSEVDELGRRLAKLNRAVEDMDVLVRQKSIFVRLVYN